MTSPTIRGMLTIAEQDLKQYLQSGVVRALEEAIEITRAILENHGFISAPTDFRCKVLKTASEAYYFQYQKDKKLSDLNEAISCWEKSLTLIPADSPQALGFLGVLLRIRFEVTAAYADLDGSVRYLEDASKLMHEGDYNERSILTNLGHMLAERFNMTGNVTELQRAIEYLERADRLHDESPHRMLSRIDLGTALLERYKKNSSITDLERSIGIYRNLSGKPRQCSRHAT